VAVSSWRAAYAGLMPDELIAKNSLAAREERFGELLARAGSAVAWDVLEQDGRMFGYSSYGPVREGGGAQVGELYALYLLPERWGQGHGRVLLERAREVLALRGYRTCELWVLSSNTRARAFYEAAGFSLAADDVPRELLGTTLLESRYECALG